LSETPFNILFSCVGRRVILVRAFRRALDSLGLTGTLVGTDLSGAASAMQVVDCAEIMPAINTLHYIPALREQVVRHSIRLIIPLTDLEDRKSVV
jgi:carbamoyl-phosphate synthase large subunit